jgi:putative hydrolase of the HAD superfamily
MDILRLKADLGHLIRERPYALDVLKFLSKSNKQMALFTNAHAGLIDMKFSCTEIGEYFENVFCAHDFGYPKEDVEFWKTLKAQFHFEPTRTLLVDDNLNVLHSARKYGIRHLLSIIQPDSQKPPRTIIDFPAVGSFEDLIIGERD